MKRIFIIVTFVLCGFYSGLAQYIETFDVKTPNNSTVYDTYIFDGIDSDLSPSEMADFLWRLKYWYDGAQMVGPASFTYNCHGYAWHVCEGGFPAWIGYDTDTAHHRYWNDSSYIEVPPAEATRIVYSGNHSAIRLDSVWCISKWGAFPLVKHFPSSTFDLYDPTSPMRYFKRAPPPPPPPPPPSISGTDILCKSSSSSFSATNMPLGSNWNCSDNLSISGSGSTITATHIPGFLGLDTTGPAWLSIELNSTELCRYDFWVGPPKSFLVSGPTSQNAGSGFYFYALISTPYTSIGWSTVPTNGVSIFSSPGGDITIGHIFFSEQSAFTTFQVKATASNKCGQVVGSHYIDIGRYAGDYK